MSDDKRALLKSMINNLINDKSEEASLDLHQYATAKMREIAGLSTAEPTVEPEVETEVEVQPEQSEDE